MHEDRFWSLIEVAWQPLGAAGAFRFELAGRTLAWEETRALRPPLRDFLRELRRELDDLPAEELLAFDRILERKLYDLDRADVHRHTGGSDDGFLYARGFIVAAGRRYYDTVNADPAAAVQDLDCEEMCFLASRLYREKFGLAPLSDISIATGSNAAGWADRT
jgi:hypothetical protein